MANTATATKTKTSNATSHESKEIREARRTLERCQRTLNSIAFKMPEAVKELEQAQQRLNTLLGTQGNGGE